LEETIFTLIGFFRVRDWFYVLGLSCLGFTYAHTFELSALSLLWFFIVSALYMAHGYSLNETIDAAIAVKNSDREFKNKKGVSFQASLSLSYLPLLINLVFLVLFSKYIFILVVAGALISYLYSVPPFRLKSVPCLDLIVNSAGFSILFLIGYCWLKPLDKNSLLVTVLFFLLFFPLQIIHELAHFEKDKSENAITTVVKCGIPLSVKLFFISWLPFTIWSMFLWLWGVLPVYVFLLSILFSAYIILRFSKILENQSTVNMNDLRNQARFLTILYGLGMLVILIKSN